ncbi:hypothetical protein FOCG_00310 [Fusarium oxysporum f. sp. radicis-lycopersici 26381]|nr:hypothetical protein FOCG_00310 [Fusarium oxysporum f. sp. radicis-lycopersici 26381]
MKGIAGVESCGKRHYLSLAVAEGRSRQLDPTPWDGG